MVFFNFIRKKLLSIIDLPVTVQRYLMRDRCAIIENISVMQLRDVSGEEKQGAIFDFVYNAAGI
jgi:hypothetical protein